MKRYLIDFGLLLVLLALMPGIYAVCLALVDRVPTAICPGTVPSWWNETFLHQFVPALATGALGGAALGAFTRTRIWLSAVLLPLPAFLWFGPFSCALCPRGQYCTSVLSRVYHVYGEWMLFFGVAIAACGLVVWLRCWRRERVSSACPSV